MPSSKLQGSSIERAGICINKNNQSNSNGEKPAKAKVVITVVVGDTYKVHSASRAERSYHGAAVLILRHSFLACL